MADSQTISVPKNEQQSPASGDSYYHQFYLFIFFCIFCFVVDSGLYLYIKVQIWSYFLVKKVLNSALKCSILCLCVAGKKQALISLSDKKDLALLGTGLQQLG